MHTAFIEYRHDDVLLEGFLAAPDDSGTPLPGIVVCHAWGGRDEFVMDRARALADMGYSAMAIDVYGKDVIGGSNEENAALMQPLVDDRGLLRDRLLAGVDALRRQDCCDESLMAAIGYCFGGLCVLDLARCGAALRGVVSFHGLLIPPGIEPGRVQARVLALHGWSDPMAPPEQVVAFGEEMDNLGADWQLHAYGRVKHAFTNPLANDDAFGTVYNASAARRSWEAMCCFFEEIFD